jgi:hypothetical protein
MATMNPPVYAWGRAAQVRTHRDRLGLGVGEFAARLGMNSRSLQRMESAAAAVPPGLFDTIAELEATFVSDVDRWVAIYDAHETDPGFVFEVSEDDTGWDRAVYAAVLARRPAAVFEYRDEKYELEASDDDPQIPVTP